LTLASPARGGKFAGAANVWHAPSDLPRLKRQELLLPTVIKGDRSREPFDEKKLLTGMQKALEKRPVSARGD